MDSRSMVRHSIRSTGNKGMDSPDWGWAGVVEWVDSEVADVDLEEAWGEWRCRWWVGWRVVCCLGISLMVEGTLVEEALEVETLEVETLEVETLEGFD